MIWFTVLKTFIVPAMLTIVVAGGGLYIKAKYDDYQTLKENNAGLTVAVNEQKQALVQKEADFAYIKESFTKQKEYTNALTNDMKELQNKFNKAKADGSKRDIGNLLLNKSGLVEKIINKGTRKVFKCFEELSKNEANNNCNNIINP